MRDQILKLIEDNPGIDAEGIICILSPEAMAIRKEVSQLLISGVIEKNNSVVRLEIFRVKV